MSGQVTTYACGHVWHTGFNGTPEEQERLRKLVNEKWSKEPCLYCQHFKDEQTVEEAAWNDYQAEEAIEPVEETPRWIKAWQHCFRGDLPSEEF
jgi:hypothetical protein